MRYTVCMPIYLTVLILGLLEGITEFLPISSTGHLIVAQEALNFNDASAIFTVVIQLGAIAAVLWFYRHDLIAKTKGLFARNAAALSFWKVLALGTVPAGLIGLAIEDKMDTITNPTVVAWALIIGGIILWLVDRRPPIEKVPDPEVEKISNKQALIVGFGQSLAIIPGVSRSGATIVSGLGAGISRPTATAFSFYLSIPVLVLASGLKLAKHPEAVSQISGGPLSIVLGIAASFVTALLAISFLLRYVSRHNFRPFAYYRVFLGIVILIFLA